ncbi:MAG: glycosyltransferase [Pirellulales bacterium]|nr:glycosyltransferase [Pirellulales bacterium]
MDSSRYTLEDRLEYSQKRVRALESELLAVRAQMDWITSRMTWRLVRCVHGVGGRSRKFFVESFIPRGKACAAALLRPVGLYPLAARVWRRIRRLKSVAVGGRGGSSASVSTAHSGAPRPEVDASEGYDVICLPVIQWNSRFQRPQQMARRQAAAGHRVFYASFGFHDGKTALLAKRESNVYEMGFPGTTGTNVYRQSPRGDDVRRMAAAVDQLRRQWRISSAVIVVQLPFWTALAEELRGRFGWPIVYDCMDDHSGFSTNCPEMLSVEERTIAEADLTVVTSDALEAKVRPRARRTALIRNGCDYEHFSHCLAAVGAAARGKSEADAPSAAKRPAATGVTVGFYGAIAEWFDADLAADLAELRPAWRFELIGSTFTGNVSRLERLPNVKLLGEQPYADLPRLVADWDAFIIPFKRIPLTEATNPVKAYEMLATGKPVVAVDLPELRPLARRRLLSLADDARGFAAEIERELGEDGPERRRLRQDFAAGNTWAERAATFDRELRDLFPKASIIVVTYNNLHLNQGCLESIFHRTDWPNYEVIVVDNASSDGTAQWLAEQEALRPDLRVIFNEDNRGFAAANNQGLRAASGEFLCLLNNDTVVTRGWLSTLIHRLRTTPKAGMVGPVSNMVGNKAKVPVGYTTIEQMHRWAASYCRQHDGETMRMIMLGFFCVLFPRKILEIVGDLDERFGVGYFEDTDYCYRVRREGYELYNVRDAFVHHWQGASFRLLGDGAFADIYRQNRRQFESKWGADSMAGAY